MKNVALIGLGPHAKRIYINYLKKHRINLALLVDIESKAKEIKTYLNKNKFKDTKLFTINDDIKDFKHLPKEESSNLASLCKTLEITHIIISTEPKAHYMYIEFALLNNINVLTDKPITVTKNMTNIKSIKEMRKEYYELLELSKHSKSSCKVMCQRQHHKGYEKVKEILSSVVDKYKVPITNIEIFHSDGAWEMPHDMEKENHPYKYGYGILYHSGYHFIDLLSDFIKINDSLINNKKIVKGEVYSNIVTPNDEIKYLTIEDYKRLFNGQNIPAYYEKNKNPKFNKYGEKDYHGLFKYTNSKGDIVTTASLNLLHNGISRRSWIETKDFYKSNGRIRHERINIEIPHLMNIQVHSYQSKEIHERTHNEESIGGLEHFDIYIFSNPILNEEPFKEIHLKDLYKEKKNFLGYNELSRETFLTNFLNDKNSKGDIKDQELSIETLYACSKALHNYYNKNNKTEKITIRNKYTFPRIAKRLKNYSNYKFKNYDSETIKGDIHFKDTYTFYTIINKIQELDIYSVFTSVDDSKDVAGSLLLKTFNNKILAYLYYFYINFLVKNMNVYYIENKIESNNKRIINNL